MHAFKYTVLDTLDQRGSRRQEIGVSTEEFLDQAYLHGLRVLSQDTNGHESQRQPTFLSNLIFQMQTKY